MRLIARLVVGALAVAFGATQAFAQDYPAQTIRIIVPFSAGGPVDTLARPLAQKLSESLGQAVIVENRPGANGIIGANAVAKATSDGYTLLLTTGAHTAIPAIAASHKRPRSTRSIRRHF